jgi:hypothetical protein
MLDSLYEEWLLPRNYPPTPAGNIRASEALIGQWIMTSLNDISAEAITTGFKKCCVPNTKGTEDGVL